MNVKRFCAPSSREALNKLRDALGPNAVILSSRSVDGQIEILALANEDLAHLQDASTPLSEPIQLTSVRATTQPTQDEVMLEAQAKFAMKKRREASSIQDHLAAENRLHNPSQISSAALMAEVRAMRSLMEQQFTELAWSHTQRKEPHKTQLLHALISAGFSASLARYLLEKMPQVADQQAGLVWIKSILFNNLQAMACDSDILEAGGVFALIGPTGVGKTTTTAKLAARCVMRHGASKLALITTDGYRIGGYEQLRIYGKILGVMVHAVKDAADLRLALSELKNKHTVLIDTVGMGQRDRLVAEQVAMLAGAKVKNLLCLNATSTGETLDEVIQAYQGSGLSGCIVTKMDEAARIGTVLDRLIQHKLTVFYLANGQRVPEDLHVMNKHYVVDQVFQFKRNQAAFQFQDDELPTLMANAALPDQPLCEVCLA